MTFLSSSKFCSSVAKVTTSILTIPILITSAFLFNTSAFANSCSKSDIDYYLQRGFTNAQVVQLCAGASTSQNTNQQTQTYQAPSQQTQQNNQLREDQSYLTAALDTDSFILTPQGITMSPRECFKYGPDTGKAAIDLQEKICVNTKLTIDFSGMKVGKPVKGIFLVRDATVDVTGNIKRDLEGISALRRQDREVAQESLSTTPSTVKLKVRNGINPRDVIERLAKYAK